MGLRVVTYCFNSCKYCWVDELNEVSNCFMNKNWHKATFIIWELSLTVRLTLFLQSEMCDLCREVKTIIGGSSDLRTLKSDPSLWNNEKWDSDSELDFIFHAPVVCKSQADKDGCEGGSASLTSHLDSAAGYEESSIAPYVHLFVYSCIDFS